MSKKFIALILIFIILFNFITIAYAIPAVLVGYGLIAFAAALTAYGITVSNNEHIQLLYSKFQDYMDSTGLTEYMQNSYFSAQNMILGTTFGVASLGIGLNTWIKEQFEQGYNNIHYDVNAEGIYIDNNNIAFTSFNIYINYPSLYSYKFWLNGMQLEFRSKDSTLTKYHVYINDALLSVNYLLSRNEVLNVEMSITDINYSARYKKESSTTWYGIGTLRSNVEEILMPDIEGETVYYYAGEAVDYPLAQYPNDRDMNLPAPVLGSPNLTYDGQDYIYTGTPDDFLTEYAENQDYINSAVESIVNPAKSASQAVVDEVSGTISFPATDTQTWPGTGVIDYPDVTVPATETEGLGSIDSKLEGIGSFINSIFLAPTVAIDFAPIMNIQIKEKFPFSVPFDLANIYGALQADPAPPQWELKWGVASTGTQATALIDFSIFEPLAKIIRWGITIIFMIGLIMLTRNMIGG